QEHAGFGDRFVNRVYQSASERISLHVNLEYTGKMREEDQNDGHRAKAIGGRDPGRCAWLRTRLNGCRPVSRGACFANRAVRPKTCSVRETLHENVSSVGRMVSILKAD